MAAGSRSATDPKPPDPGVIMSMTEPTGAANAPLLGRRRVTAVRRRERHDSCRARRGRHAGRTAARSSAPCTMLRSHQRPPTSAKRACAAAPAVTASAARVRIDLVAFDAHRKGHLQHFHCRVHRIRDAQSYRPLVRTIFQRVKFNSIVLASKTHHSIQISRALLLFATNLWQNVVFKCQRKLRRRL